MTLLKRVERLVENFVEELRRRGEHEQSYAVGYASELITAAITGDEAFIKEAERETR